MAFLVSRLAGAALSVALAAAIAPCVQAALIYSSSDDTVAVDSNYDGVFAVASPSAVEIAPHAAWQPAPIAPNSPARWISYANTGIGGGATLAPFNPACSAANPDECRVLMRVTETFTAPDIAWLSLKAWADDTVAISLDGNPMVVPNFTQDICARGSPGCEPDEFAALETEVAAGSHTLTFDTYQVGQGTTPQNNPFGLLYDGTIIVPEPLSLALLGAGLLGLGLAAQRRRH